MLSVRNLKGLTILGILLLLVLPWTAKADNNGNNTLEYVNTEYNHVASNMVGEPIVVHCVNMRSDWGGFSTPVVDQYGNQSFNPDIYLQKYICSALGELIHYTPKHYLKGTTWQEDKEWRMAEALLTLVHESGHIKLNSTSEGIVECWAIRHVAYYLTWFDLPHMVSVHVLKDMHENHSLASAKYTAVC